MVNVEKSRGAAEEGKQELQLTPRRVLPTLKPVKIAEKEASHSPEEIHQRLASHYSLSSESAGRGGAKASLDMEIARNMDDHKVKWGEPLHKRFGKLVATL